MQLDLERGTLVAGDFRIERPLGRGGMGAVYVAEQLSTGRLRALKVMSSSLVKDEGMRRRFEQEAKVGSRIKSDHVVEVIAAGVDADTGMPWIAMELLEGEDLDTRVRRTGVLDSASARDILSELCHGLSAAHAAGVVHRDLKPENVFLARAHRKGATTTVKLLDLGIAKLVAESASDTAALGTPLWMAPEQTGGKVGACTDIWALGLLVFWMLTGKHYWLAANEPSGQISLMHVLREVAADPTEPASVRARELGIADRLPEGFDAWFARAVVREPEQRFSDVSEALAGLERVWLGAEATLELPKEALPRAVHGGQAPVSAAEARTGNPDAAAAVRGQRSAQRWHLPAVVAVLAAAGIGAYISHQSGVAPGVSSQGSSSALPGGSGSAATAASSRPEADAGSSEVDHTDSQTVWNVPVGDSPVRGAADAPVTIVEFGNFQCPFSKAVSAKLRALVDEFPGQVRLVWKDDPLAIHFQAESAAHLAREARARKGESGFWAAHDILIDPETKLTPEVLAAAAKKLDLPPAVLTELAQSRRHAEAISHDAELADDFAVAGTPYFFVNGRRAQATQSLDKLREVVKAELERTGALLSQGTPKAGLYERVTAGGRAGLPFDVRQFKGVPGTAPGRGRPDAGALLVEFASYTDFRARLLQPTVDQLLNSHKDVLGLAWVDNPEAADPSRHAALVARATSHALTEDDWLKLQPLLFAKQLEPGGLTRAGTDEAAAAVGLKKDLVAKQMADATLVSEMEADTSLTKSLGPVDGPVFLICRNAYCEGGGYFLTAAHPARAFERRIRLALDNPKGPLPRTR